MASDYHANSTETSALRTGIGRSCSQYYWQTSYDDRTHFSFELLQNASERLGRPLLWQVFSQLRSRFELTEKRTPRSAIAASRFES